MKAPMIAPSLLAPSLLAPSLLAMALLAAGAAPTLALESQAGATARASTSASATAPTQPGEPLPPGAPSQPYELSAWCYGALGEYLGVYQRVTPDLRAIDKMFGSSVKNEKEPYAADMAAARVELKVLAGAVEAAEKASPTPIALRGAIAIKQGVAIWRPAETKTNRELARAWLSWGLPDQCDTTARALIASSTLLGQALKYNAPAPSDAPAAEAPAPTPDAPPPAPPSEAPSVPPQDATPPPTSPPPKL